MNSGKSSDNMIMNKINPRWEWRSFGQCFGEAESRQAAEHQRVPTRRWVKPRPHAAPAALLRLVDVVRTPDPRFG